MVKHVNTIGIWDHDLAMSSYVGMILQVLVMFVEELKYSYKCWNYLCSHKNVCQKQIGLLIFDLKCLFQNRVEKTIIDHTEELELGYLLAWVACQFQERKDDDQKSQECWQWN
jgi:hypothetical protein